MHNSNFRPMPILQVLLGCGSNSHIHTPKSHFHIFKVMSVIYVGHLIRKFPSDTIWRLIYPTPNREGPDTPLRNIPIPSTSTDSKLTKPCQSTSPNQWHKANPFLKSFTKPTRALYLINSNVLIKVLILLNMSK